MNKEYNPNRVFKSIDHNHPKQPHKPQKYFISAQYARIGRVNEQINHTIPYFDTLKASDPDNPNFTSNIMSNISDALETEGYSGILASIIALRSKMIQQNRIKMDMDEYGVTNNETLLMHPRPPKLNQLRQSGDESITHELYMIDRAIAHGFSSEDIIRLLYSHDLKEDQLNFWNQQASGWFKDKPKDIYVINGLTKTPSDKTRKDKEEARKEAEIDTIRRLFEAYLKDPRVLIVKFFDIYSNLMTIMDMKDNTRRKNRAERYFEAFDGIFRMFADEYLVNECADKAFEAANPGEFSSIRQKINDQDKKFIKKNGINLMDWLTSKITGIQEGFGLYKLYPGIQNQHVQPISISAKARSAYRIYQYQNGGNEDFTYKPYLRMVFAQDSDLRSWEGYIKQEFGTKTIKRGQSDVLLIDLGANEMGEENFIEVQLVTEDDVIKPWDLYKENRPLTESQRTVAMDKKRKLDQKIRDKLDGIEPMLDSRLESDLQEIIFQTPKGDIFRVNEGDSILEGLSCIHPIFLEDTLFAEVTDRNGQTTYKSINDRITNGDTIVAIVNDDIETKASKLGKNPIYKVLSQQERIDIVKAKYLSKIEDTNLCEQIALDMEGLSPIRFDYIKSPENIRNLAKKMDIDNIPDNKERYKKGARLRARKMIALLYKERESGNRSWDQFVEDGITTKLLADYENGDENEKIDMLLEEIGFLPLRLQADTLQKWKSKSNFALNEAQIKTAEKLDTIVDNLIKYRKNLPTVYIRNLINDTNIYWILKELKEVFGMDWLPFRASADNLKDSHDHPVIIELGIRSMQNGTIKEFMELFRYFYPQAQLESRIPNN